MDDFEDVDIEYYKLMHPIEFPKRMAEKYQLDEENFKKFFRDFDPISRDFCNFGGLDEVPHHFKKISQLSGMTVLALRRLQHIGAISRPINYNDMEFIGRLLLACRDTNFLRSQISNLSYQRRQDLITRPELSSKWERWAYKRFFTPEIEYGDGGRMLNPEKRIKIFELAAQIESMFGVPNCFNTRERLKKIRTTAFNDRRRSKPESELIEDLAARRGISAEELKMALGLWEPPGSDK